MIHIAICDDERDFVAHLTGLLARYRGQGSVQADEGRFVLKIMIPVP